MDVNSDKPPAPYRRLSLTDLMLLVAAAAVGLGGWDFRMGMSGMRNAMPTDALGWINLASFELCALALMIAATSLRLPARERLQPGFVTGYALFFALVFMLTTRVAGFDWVISSWGFLGYISFHELIFICPRLPHSVVAPMGCGWLLLLGFGRWRRSSGALERAGRWVGYGFLILNAQLLGDQTVQMYRARPPSWERILQFGSVLLGLAIVVAGLAVGWCQINPTAVQAPPTRRRPTLRDLAWLGLVFALGMMGCRFLVNFKGPWGVIPPLPVTFNRWSLLGTIWLVALAWVGVIRSSSLPRPARFQPGYVACSAAVGSSLILFARGFFPIDWGTLETQSVATYVPDLYLGACQDETGIVAAIALGWLLVFWGGGWHRSTDLTEQVGRRVGVGFLALFVGFCLTSCLNTAAGQHRDLEPFVPQFFLRRDGDSASDPLRGGPPGPAVLAWA